jgi:hypothetical protein
MRPATHVLLVSLLAGPIGGLLISAPARASLLPQIQEARALQEQQGAWTRTLTKHYVEVKPGVKVAVRGARERRQVRFARWVESLTGDRLAVFEAAGFPLYRHRETAGGDRTELWTYPEEGRVYVFRDEDLVEIRLD